jgi:hypothetical protein
MTRFAGETATLHRRTDEKACLQWVVKMVSQNSRPNLQNMQNLGGLQQPGKQHLAIDGRGNRRGRGARAPGRAIAIVNAGHSRAAICAGGAHRR